MVKNKQTSLEERIARAKKTLGKMHIPQVINLIFHFDVRTCSNITDYKGGAEDEYIEM